MNRDATSIFAVILMRKRKSLTQWTLSGNIRKDGLPSMRKLIRYWQNWKLCCREV
jgi:hypothetical protein